MKHFSIMALCAIACVSHAHDLTKAEAGREKVSACYSRCTVDVANLTNGANAVYASTVGQLVDLLGRAARSGIDLTRDPSFDELDEAVKYLSCSSVQTLLNVSDLCDAGCRDLEHVYGPVSSWAKTRFRYHYGEERGIAREAGLWQDYRNYPRRKEDGHEFDLACRRYLAD